MPYISKASIQEVMDRMDVNAVVSDYVRLEKRGGRFWACCPFHQEKTASFTVNPDLKSYYCFGCQKGGTLINFVMEMDKINFPEAIELLAKKFGVKLVYDSSGNYIFGDDEEEKKKKDELFELYRRICGTFHHFLLKNPEAEGAKQYIISRGINSKMIEHFSLGYAPLERHWLHTFLSGKGYSPDFLAESGLFSSRDKKASLFSGRLMFPINNQQGRTVAFGGRYLNGNSAQGREWEAPKYINSPELGIYKKRETLYALDFAMAELRRTKTAYIAEGYLDVIALHQAGITNSIAPLGTAFTDEQAKLLKRWASKLIFFFDSDNAGQAATLKGVYTCRRNGLSCAVVTPVETSKDPADILLKSGPEALNKTAKCFINDFDFLLAQARELFAGSGGKDQAVALLFPYLELLDSEVARVSSFEAIADSFGLPVKAVTEDFSRYAAGIASGGRGIIQSEAMNDSISMNEEISLLTALALDYISSNNDGHKSSESLLLKFRSAVEISDIDDPNAKEIFVTLEECIRYGERSMDEFLSRISSRDLKEFILERSVSGEFLINTRQLINDGIKKIKMKILKHRQEEIIIKLRSVKKNNLKEAHNEKMYVTDEGLEDPANGLAVRELLSEKMQIDSELHQLKQG